MSKDRRIWIKLAVQMPDSPKIAILSDAAFRAQIEALCYCRELRTDGFIPRRVAMQRWGADVVAELLANDADDPSWIEVENGFQLHDYLKHQESRADIEAREKQVREASAKGVAARKRNRERNRDGNRSGNRNGAPGGLPESESESESERLPIETNTVSPVVDAREISTDPETASIIWGKAQRAGFQTLEQFWEFWSLVQEHTDRDIEPAQIVNLVDEIAKKSKTLVRDRIAYARTAVMNSPHDVRRMIDAGIPWGESRLEAV